MSIRFLSLIALTGAAVFVGCENRPSHTLGPSTLENAKPAGVANPAQLGGTGASQHAVTIFDACDPETFNAALGAGTCTRSGGVQFDRRMISGEKVAAVERQERPRFTRQWQLRCPAVVESLKEPGEELFTFLLVPRSQWRALRTRSGQIKLRTPQNRHARWNGSG
jgi:hypothetical protein